MIAAPTAFGVRADETEANDDQRFWSPRHEAPQLSGTVFRGKRSDLMRRGLFVIVAIACGIQMCVTQEK